MNNIDTKYFAGHESFYLREGWLKKGLDILAENPDLFQGSNLIDSINKLGVGSNMVKAMRYWLEKCDIIIKNNKTHEYTLTEECKLIRTYDSYFQHKNTLWILHYNISKNSRIWECLNCQDVALFGKEDMINQISNMFKENNAKFANKTIKDSINTFVNTYTPNKKIVDPEDNIISPLSKLKLITHFDDKYRFRDITLDDFDPLVIYYLFINDITTVQLSDLYSEIRKYFKMELNILRKALDVLENDNYLTIDRAAGLNNIRPKKSLSKDKLFKQLMKE
jgi:hypothetical protein